MRQRFKAMLIMLLVSTLSAGVYMKQKHHTDAIQMMGQTQPAVDTIQEIWITDEGFRNDSQETSTLFNKKKNVMAILNHQKKTYFELPMGQNMMPGMMEGDEEETAEMQQMMSQIMQMDIQVKSTSETKTINGWPCKKYIMKISMAMGTIENEIWAT